MIAPSEPDNTYMLYAHTDAGWVEVSSPNGTGDNVLIVSRTEVQSESVTVEEEPPSKQSEADAEKLLFLIARDLAKATRISRIWLGGQLRRRNGKECDPPLIRIGRYTSGFV